MGNVGFTIEGAVDPQQSMPAKTTRFEHYKESFSAFYAFRFSASACAFGSVLRVLRVLSILERSGALSSFCAFS